MNLFIHTHIHFFN